jgi:predicted dehydrogenase
MKILVLGAGMYVTGRDNSGVGTVLSSLIQTSKQVAIDEIVVVARSRKNETIVDEAAERINNNLDTDISVNYLALNGTDLDEICRTHRFTCAVVSTPDHLHFEHLQTLISNGIHVLSVKPLVATTLENRQLISLQKANNVLGMVEFHKRYDEANLYTKKAIADNRIGRILYFDVDYSQRIGIPQSTFKDWVTQTNIFQYLGVHYVDLYYFLTGFKPVRLSACGTRGRLEETGIDTHDSIHATIIWQDDKARESVSTFNVSWVDPECTSALSDQKYKIVGTLGRIENDHKNRGMELVSEDGRILTPNPYFSEYLLDADGNQAFSGYGHKSIRQFVLDVVAVLEHEKSIESFEPIRPTFSQSLVATGVIEAVNKSLENDAEWERIDVAL